MPMQVAAGSALTYSSWEAAGVSVAMEDVDAVERFLHRDQDGWIVDVDEFQVARALLSGEAQLLGREVDSWHLFDWCLYFGHRNTALAMWSHGVPGCVIRAWHVAGPADRLLDADYADACDIFAVCECWGPWATCSACNWGYLPEEEGVWMEDWDASLRSAKKKASRAASMPFLRHLLEACRSQAAFPAEVTAEAMARVLDVAILLGDAELAACCTRRCTLFPLRRWRFDDFVVRNLVFLPIIREIREKDILKAALAAGVGLQSVGDCFFSDVSLPEAIVLSEDAELWQLGPWPTAAPENNKAKYLLTDAADGDWCLSFERLLRAKRAGLTLGTYRLRSFLRCTACPGSWPATEIFLSLLDLAIIFEQRDCAELCGSMDVCSTEWTLGLSLEEPPACNICGSSSVIELGHLGLGGFFGRIARLAPLVGRKAAAGEALRAALRASRGRAREMAGLGVLQALRWWARGKVFSPALVNVVLTFSAERPSLARALEGRWGELLQSPWWEEPDQHTAPMESLQRDRDDAEPFRSEESCDTARPSADLDPASGAHAPAPPSHLSSEKPSGPSGPDQASTDDLLAALRNSRSDLPPLSGDGAVIFRLTRRANAEEVHAVLFDETGPLWTLHRRVLEATCSFGCFHACLAYSL